MAKPFVAGRPTEALVPAANVRISTPASNTKKQMSCATRRDQQLFKNRHIHETARFGKQTKEMHVRTYIRGGGQYGLRACRCTIRSQPPSDTRGGLYPPLPLPAPLPSSLLMTWSPSPPSLLLHVAASSRVSFSILCFIKFGFSNLFLNT